MRTSTRTLGACLAGVLLLYTAGCQGQAATDDRARQGGQQSPNSHLPTVRVAVDEDGATSVNQAVNVSDYVVIGEVLAQRDGVRYFGGDDGEASGADAFEAVEWTIAVEEWVSGEPTAADDELKITGTAYTVDPATKERTGVIQAEGVDLPLQVGSRYVLFLEEQPEPWGLTFVSAGAALMELDEQDNVSGEIAEVFEEHVGEPVEEVLP